MKIDKVITCPACNNESVYNIDGLKDSVVMCHACLVELEINPDNKTVTASFRFNGDGIRNWRNK